MVFPVFVWSVYCLFRQYCRLLCLHIRQEFFYVHFPHQTLEVVLPEAPTFPILDSFVESSVGASFFDLFTFWAPSSGLFIASHFKDGLSPCCRFGSASELPSGSLYRTRSLALGERGRQTDFQGFFYSQESNCFFRVCGSFLPSLASFSSVPEDKLWCPVRALKWYLKRTRERRSSSDLFVTTTAPHGAASKDTISRWLMECIKLSGEDSLRIGPVRAHVTRLLSTSWALFNGKVCPGARLFPQRARKSFTV